jgi:AcrR family transcriptional regulator
LVDKPRRSKGEKGEQTRRRILLAAERRFAESGFAEARIEDVAKDAGLATSAVLYHFADKRALYREVLGEVVSPLFADLQRALAAPGELPARVDAGVEALVDYAARRPSAAFLTLREVVSAGPAQRRDTPLAAQLVDTLRRVFEAEGPGPSRTDPLHFASAIGGVVVFYIAAVPAFLPQLPHPHLSPDQIAILKRDTKAIAQRLLRGSSEADPSATP